MSEFDDFLEDYRRTWETVMNAGDVAPLTRFFHMPYFALGPDGRLELFQNDKAVRAFSRAAMC